MVVRYDGDLDVFCATNYAAQEMEEARFVAGFFSLDVPYSVRGEPVRRTLFWPPFRGQSNPAYHFPLSTPFLRIQASSIIPDPASRQGLMHLILQI
jgi:hypothetical protein